MGRSVDVNKPARMGPFVDVPNSYVTGTYTHGCVLDDEYTKSNHPLKSNPSRKPECCKSSFRVTSMGRSVDDPAC